MKKIIAIPKLFSTFSLLAFILFIFLLACSFETDGGGSDQPNRLVGTITGNDGIAMSAARVRLYAGAYRPGYDIGLEPSDAVLDTEVHTDKRGSFTVRKFQAAHFLEARNADSSSIWIEDSLTINQSSPSLGSFNLTEGASIKGTVVSSSPVSAMLIAGTHFQTIPESSGKFNFPLLPAGKFRLVARMGGAYAGQLVPAGVVDVNAGQTLDVDSLSAEPNQILMFTFDTVENFSRLRGLTFPYAQAETNLLGGWWPRPQDLVSVGAFRKKSLHAKMMPREHIGFSMGLGYQDLSKMTALSFWAKGTGTIVAFFHSKLIPTGDPTFRDSITLSPTWTEYKILPANIASPDSAAKNYTWNLGKSKIGKVTFSPDSSGAEIWLDEIRFEGLTYKDLGVPEPAGGDALPNK